MAREFTPARKMGAEAERRPLDRRGIVGLLSLPGRLSAVHTVLASAPAKVNLALRVGPPRLDGFHPLDTVFEALDLFDDVRATALPDSDSVAQAGSGNRSVRLRYEGDDGGAPTGDTNLAVRAAQLLRERYGIADGVELTLTKRIPVAAGLAGGSADAAATLVACNELWGLGLDAPTLRELGAELGSDVPFCLLGGVAHATGRGEELRVLRPGTMHSWILLVSPHGLSTPDVFREFDAIMGYRPVPESLVPETEELQGTVGTADLRRMAPLMVNDLQEAAFSLYPTLRSIIGKANSYGVAALVSGSGPTVAVLAEDATTADALAGRLARDFPELTALRADGPAGGAHIRDAF
ncbi:4-(cytidine 5'-diphospho)-2-C-methyl-D-erythritol kinase [Actinobaculum sp. 352]|uniref:4-(cytidine 5'-diphospho)-2-C-methyl-D-erythritol kinase n=1 Tax=Actinobaculum sp. 352 TaxID=2490946 RepID=UPI000F7E6FD5|nr:4-(cytidine 5'-diphospho)-2-C-methyl-D-erythritol kinase [Actinobaculum sp. 352]RTE50275.1 4-(cytidine 5'-diphospho)-2-C-methyl-D-erythritol kinase [Actinobaculum sp. 352]